MRNQRNEKGFILMEIMAALAVICLLSVSVTELMSGRYRMTVRQLEKEKACYAAISAVRLLAEAVVTETDDMRIFEMEAEEFCGSLQFQSEERSDFVPVTVWVEIEEDMLILYAKAGSEHVSQTAALTMEYIDGWVPIGYELSGRE